MYLICIQFDSHVSVMHMNVAHLSPCFCVFDSKYIGTKICVYKSKMPRKFLINGKICNILKVKVIIAYLVVKYVSLCVFPY